MPPVLPGNSNVETAANAHAPSEHAQSVIVSAVMQKRTVSSGVRCTFSLGRIAPQSLLTSDATNHRRLPTSIRYSYQKAVTNK